MSERPSVFYNPKILKIKRETEPIRHFEHFFLTHKARKEVPTWPEVLAIHGGEPNELFKRSYAIALLCKKHIYGNEVALPPELESLKPFESEKFPGTPTLRELMSGTLSLVFFPTILEDKSSAQEDKSSVIMMFVFQPNPEDKTEYNDHRSLLCGELSDIPGDHRFYLMKGLAPVTCTIAGNSWQLACRMGEKALAYNPCSADGKRWNTSKIMGYRSKVLNWLITGAVTGEATASVTIGNKASLLHTYPDAFKLLIPKADESQIEESPFKDRIRVADSIEHAWRIITETGFESGTIHLPDSIEELHLLVGESIQHLLLVAFLLYPAKLVLWHSKKTKSQAELIKQFYDDLGKGIEVEVRQVDSHDMGNCYKAFNERLTQVGNLHSIIINNTGGNRLMGFAASLVARDLGITVVYRDFDQVIDAMIGIQFENSKFITGDICGIKRWPDTNPAVNWEKMIYQLPDNLDELKKQVFKEPE